MKSTNQNIKFKEVSLTIKREDLIHPIISGNKYRKLKYNLQEAKQLQKSTLLTFGGAFSNHIAAVAGAGNEFGYKTIGIIRGEELKDKISSNPTLCYAKKCGMQLEFVSRSDYRKKNEKTFIDKLTAKFGDFYLIPEGGTNSLAIKGCEEILTKHDSEFDYICVPVGTCGTIVGLINSAKAGQKILGFPALKGTFFNQEIEKLTPNKKNWLLITDYHFGGYAKVDEKLVNFTNEFKEKTNIALDPIYTAKMLYGVIELAKKEYFKKGSKILVIHTGGLQGIKGINSKLKKQNKNIII